MVRVHGVGRPHRRRDSRTHAAGHCGTGRLYAHMPAAGPPPLEDLALATLARHIACVSPGASLAGLPDHVALRLWAAVLASGGLTPAVLALFRCLSPEVIAATAATVADPDAWAPPVLAGQGHRGWLGDAPPWAR
jgi:hypothetical protein